MLVRCAQAKEEQEQTEREEARAKAEAESKVSVLLRPAWHAVATPGHHTLPHSTLAAYGSRPLPRTLVPPVQLLPSCRHARVTGPAIG